MTLNLDLLKSEWEKILTITEISQRKWEASPNATNKRKIQTIPCGTK